MAASAAPPGGLPRLEPWTELPFLGGMSYLFCIPAEFFRGISFSLATLFWIPFTVGRECVGGGVVRMCARRGKQFKRMEIVMLPCGK